MLTGRAVPAGLYVVEVRRGRSDAAQPAKFRCSPPPSRSGSAINPIDAGGRFKKRLEEFTARIILE